MATVSSNAPVPPSAAAHGSGPALLAAGLAGAAAAALVLLRSLAVEAIDLGLAAAALVGVAGTLVVLGAWRPGRELALAGVAAGTPALATGAVLALGGADVALVAGSVLAIAALALPLWPAAHAGTRLRARCSGAGRSPA
jgi:hypothetical protein